MAKNSPKSSLLQAVPINPKTGKQARGMRGQAVIYGYKAADGSITPLDMQSQGYTKTEQRDLQRLVNRNKITAPPDTVFFQKRTTRNEKYKGGETYKEKVTDRKTGKQVIKIKRAKKGEQRYIRKHFQKVSKAKVLKVTFKPPSYRTVKGERVLPVYKKIAMKMQRGKMKQHSIDWRLMERNKLERLQDQMLAGMTKLKSKDLEGAKSGSVIENVVLRGKTLAQTLSTVRPPQSFEKLRKQGVTGIGVDVTVKFKDTDGVWKSFPVSIGAIGLNEYGDISTILSKMIRSELFAHGKTFTKLATLKKIRGREKANAKRTGEPYIKNWQGTQKVWDSNGKIHDMNVAFNKPSNPYDELKQGNLKVDVTFRYYTGQEQM